MWKYTAMRLYTVAIDIAIAIRDRILNRGLQLTWKPTIDRQQRNDYGNS
jgi:hypothetical protein